MAAIDAHDLAFGTSRWSSKLVHGGLRYLAKGQVGIAYESAYERGILMTRTAPHLVRALPGLLPLTPAVAPYQAALAAGGFRGGDLLRLLARTPRSVLPKPRRIDRNETLAVAPVVKRESLRGGLLGWDGQLEDDARLVTALARTAAGCGAAILTRVRAVDLGGGGAQVEDTFGGARGTIRAKAVINATGVWADTLCPEISLRPSRGTHVVLRRSSLPGLRTQLVAPVPDEFNRFVFAVPQPDGTVYLGLTDEPQDGPLPEVPQPSDSEIDFLLRVIAGVLETPLDRSHVVGAYAGLRPLLQGDGKSADLSRKHAVMTSKQRRGDRGGREADDVPSHGSGRRRHRHSPGQGLRRQVPDQANSPWSARSGPSRTPRLGCSASTAPRPARSSRLPSPSPAAPPRKSRHR